MNLVERFHAGVVSGRRARILSRHLSDVIPENSAVLDVGCGDGLIDHLLLDLRPDLDLRGIDALVRPKTAMTVTGFDGKVLPFADSSFDCVMFVDVLHHMVDPMVLLREAVRVSRNSLIIKDHAREGFLGESTLRFMDKIGNERHGVALPYNYWTMQQWRAAWDHLGLRFVSWMPKLGLYPWPATWIFDRRLHFIVRLDRN